VAVLGAMFMVAALVLGHLYGAIHPSKQPTGAESHFELLAVAWGAAVVVLASGSVVTRRTATMLGRIVASHTVRAAGVVVRLETSIVGYVIVLVLALELLGVSLVHLLTDATLVGVVLGIAAQQTLGNVFAGMVLLLARPFTIGDHIVIRSGAMGGIFDGVVLSMSLTYVTLSTENGLLKLPNSGMLAAAIGPYRPPPAPQAPGPGLDTGQVPVTGSTAVIPEPGTDTRPPPVTAPAAAELGARVVANPWRQLAAREDRLAAARRAQTGPAGEGPSGEQPPAEQPPAP